jgi:hypothetical protein
MIEVTKAVVATLAMLVQAAPSKHGQVVGAGYSKWADPGGGLAVWALYDVGKPVTEVEPHEPLTACLVGMYDLATATHRAIRAIDTGDAARLARSEFEPVVRFADWVEHRTGEVTATFELPLD